MKINDSINLNKLYINIDNELLKEGDLIEGKLLDIIDDIVLIEIKDLGIIEAYIEGNLNEQKGEVLTFIIKSLLPSKIELKPVLNNIGHKESTEFINKPKDYLINILKEFHIKDDPVSIEFLDNLIRYNVKIDKENILNGIRVLDKLEQISNLNEDEVIIFTNAENETLNIGKEDIRNFIITNKEQININNLNLVDKEEIKFAQKVDLAPIMKEFLNTSLAGKIKSDIIKTISFFVKFNIKPTLNNIKYFLKLKEDPESFSENFKILEEIVDKKFTNPDKKLIINKGSPKNLIEENNIQYKQTLNRIKEYIREEFHLMNENTKKTVEELSNKIEFLEEMNKELNFIYLPLSLDNDKYNSGITLLKKKKKRNGFNGKINIFINLKTKKLGNIKISCEVLNSTMNIKFNHINKEDVNLFISKEEELRTLVKATGYEIKSIEYLFEKNYDILDSLIVNTKPIYYLDVQV